MKALGTSSLGYFSHEIGTARPATPNVLARRDPPTALSRRMPLSSPLRYAPHEAIANLRALSENLPDLRPVGVPATPSTSRPG